MTEPDRPPCNVQPECVSPLDRGALQRASAAAAASGLPLRRAAFVTYHTSPLAVPGQGDSGGLNVYVRDLAEHLRGSGVAADVFCRRDDKSLPPMVETSGGVRVFHVPAGPAAPVPKESLPAHLEEFAETLALLIEDGGYHVVHSHYWMSGLAALTAAKGANAPVVHTAHTLATLRALPDGGGERLAAERRIATEADLMVASTPHEAECLTEAYGAAPCRVEVIPPGVDHERFLPGDRAGARARLDLTDADLVVLFLGRIQRLKGADLAAEALAELSRRAPTLAQRTTFLVAGGPSGEDGWETLQAMRDVTSGARFLPAVRYLAARPHDQVADLYRAADVCIVPSRSESFGLVALEAQATGVPVVASAVDGLLHLVEHGRSGLLVPRRTPAGFALGLETLLGNDCLRARMGRHAQAVSATYSWTLAAARHRVAYADLLAPESQVVCG